METSLVSDEPGYSKYYNFPSCSAVSGDWADRYWGANLPALLDIKDGENIALVDQHSNEFPRVGPRQRVQPLPECGQLPAVRPGLLPLLRGGGHPDNHHSLISADIRVIIG